MPFKTKGSHEMSLKSQSYLLYSDLDPADIIKLKIIANSSIDVATSALLNEIGLETNDVESVPLK